MIARLLIRALAPFVVAALAASPGSSQARNFFDVTQRDEDQVSSAQLATSVPCLTDLLNRPACRRAVLAEQAVYRGFQNDLSGLLVPASLVKATQLLRAGLAELTTTASQYVQALDSGKDLSQLDPAGRITHGSIVYDEATSAINDARPQPASSQAAPTLVDTSNLGFVVIVLLVLTTVLGVASVVFGLVDAGLKQKRESAATAAPNKRSAARRRTADPVAALVQALSTVSESLIRLINSQRRTPLGTVEIALRNGASLAAIATFVLFLLGLKR